jgi:hypothetical protein
MEEMLPRALPRDVPDYHERQAAHFRALASTVTTRRVKTRLLQEAEQHEQIARGEPVLTFMDQQDTGESISAASATNGAWLGLAIPGADPSTAPQSTPVPRRVGRELAGDRYRLGQDGGRDRHSPFPCRITGPRARLFSCAQPQEASACRPVTRLCPARNSPRNCLCHRLLRARPDRPAMRPLLNHDSRTASHS